MQNDSSFSASQYTAYLKVLGLAKYNTTKCHSHQEDSELRQNQGLAESSAAFNDADAFPPANNMCEHGVTALEATEDHSLSYFYSTTPSYTTASVPNLMSIVAQAIQGDANFVLSGTESIARHRSAAEQKSGQVNDRPLPALEWGYRPWLLALMALSRTKLVYHTRR